MRDVIFFIIALLAPFIYWRAMFVWAKKFAEKPRLVGKTGIQIHHLHHGILLIFLAAAGLLFLGKNTWVILVLGLGLGMVLDEFISSLMLPEDRPFGLALYRKSFKSTCILFSIISILLLALAFYIR